VSKKPPKRAEDDRELKKKIAELFRAIGDEKRAILAETGRDVGRAIAALFRTLNDEKNAKRAADLKKKITELLEDNEQSKRAADLKKTIAEMFRAIEEWKSSGMVSLGLLDRARELTQSWHPELGKTGDPLVTLLAGLVVAQEREIERLAKLQLFRRTQPSQEEVKSKQKYDLKRSYVPVVGTIESEFGGVRPPGVWDMHDSVSEPPTCLDDIFSGHAVNMLGLVQLFGRDRHLLANLVGVRIKKGRPTPYDYRTVKDIMDALLRPQNRKGSTRGRPSKEPWLSDPPPTDWRPVNHFWSVRHYCRSLRGSVREPLRTRVLTGIEGRINSLSERVPKHIKSAFLAVIHRHLPDSGKK
jgi:hypothetical protein